MAFGFCLAKPSAARGRCPTAVHRRRKRSPLPKPQLLTAGATEMGGGQIGVLAVEAESARVDLKHLPQLIGHNAIAGHSLAPVMAVELAAGELPQAIEDAG